MARKRYIETHSNYTLKRLHQVTSKGNVYESDLMTITELGGFAPDQLPIYSHGNFKLSIRKGLNHKIKHEGSTWLINENCGEGTTVWSPDCLGEKSAITSTINHIKLNPDYTELGEFVCYGSAVELIRASLSDIILHFPAELYLTHEHYSIFKDDTTEEKINLGGDDLYIVRNPFLINLIAKTVPSNVIDKRRYFCESWQEYVFLPTVEPIYCPGQELGDDLKWYVIEHKKVYCANDGDLIATVKLGVCNIYYYYYNGELIILHDYQGGTAHIRLKEKHIEDFFENLNDFEKQILNRKTGYTWKLRTPRETDKGIFVTLEKYQWPTTDDWNLDFSSPAYQNYVNRLMNVAELYDKYYSDNVVRSMTHEALKNFDWTHTKQSKDTTVIYEDPNPYKMECFFHVFGAKMDVMKMYIKNIKNANNLTYNGLNNIPDYFLKRKLELNGWEVKNPISGASDIYTKTALYPADSVGYSIDDANNKFLKILALSSKAILRAKGTKMGLEMLFAIFGFHSLNFIQKRLYDNGRKWDDLTDDEKRDACKYMYRFAEYVGIAYNPHDTDMVGYERCDNLTVRRLNARKDGYTIPFNDYNSVDEVELQGLPVKPVSVSLADGSDATYLVPWFDKDTDYDTYFQAKGGWGKNKVKYDTIPVFGEIEITSDDDFSIYEETSKYLHYALNISELLATPYSSLESGDIYYVDDITGGEDEYSTLSGETATLSHYFVLEDKEFCNNFGCDASGNWGWKNVSTAELSGQTTTEAKKVLYLETIKNDRKGNNPHTGYGNYDNGNEYIENFKEIFKNATFNSVSDSVIEGYEDIGFDIEVQTDNTKCWYFTDTTLENSTLYELTELDADTYEAQTMEDVTFDDDTSLRPTETETGHIIPYNMESGGLYYDEAAANSIINLKNFEINFYPTTVPGMSQYDFVSRIVMFYAKQIIPSSAIFNYRVSDTWVHTAELCKVGGNY